MTPTFLRHTLSTLAAVALVSAFAGSAVSADHPSVFNYFKNANAGQAKTPKALATKKEQDGGGGYTSTFRMPRDAKGR